MNQIKKVLSVQSHVSHGYVGNRIAVFALQILGFETDEIHTVNYSNHTGYPVVKGHGLTSTSFKELYEGLTENHLLCYDYILTGYLGSESCGIELVNLIDDNKRTNSHARYICDPVLGDEGEYYTSRELLLIYTTQLIPRYHNAHFEVVFYLNPVYRSYMITPNQFEAEEITGRSNIALSCQKSRHR